MTSPFKYSFTNYYDLLNKLRSGISWDEKTAIKRELEKREARKDRSHDQQI